MFDEALFRTGLKHACEFLWAVSTQLNVPIAVERMAVTHRYLSEPRLRVVADRDDRYSGNSVEAFDYIVVVNIIRLVKGHDEGIFDGVTEKLVDIVDGRASRDLVVDIDRMLVKCLAEDCTGTLAEASDVSVRDRGALFKPIESVSREHGFTDATRTADQGVTWGRSAKRRLKRTRELTHFGLAVYQLSREVDVFENTGIDDHNG